MTQIGTMYARALYSLAAEEGCTEEVLSALSALETSVEQEPEFLRLLSTPNLSKEDRCKIIDDSFSGKMPEILLSELPALYYGVGKKISAVQKTFQRFFYSVFAVGFGIQSNTVNTGSNEESLILYCNLPECNNGNALSVFVQLRSNVLVILSIKCFGRFAKRTDTNVIRTRLLGGRNT